MGANCGAQAPVFCPPPSPLPAPNQTPGVLRTGPGPPHLDPPTHRIGQPGHQRRPENIFGTREKGSKISLDVFLPPRGGGGVARSKLQATPADRCPRGPVLLLCFFWMSRQHSAALALGPRRQLSSTGEGVMN